MDKSPFITGRRMPWEHAANAVPGHLRRLHMMAARRHSIHDINMQPRNVTRLARGFTAS